MPTAKPTEKTVDRVPIDWRALKPLFIFLLIYALGFFALAYRKFYVMNTNSGDSAVVANLYWQTIHGKPFFCEVLQENHLGVHASYLALLFLPLYALIPSIWTLFFQQSLLMAASGIPFFLICRRVFQSQWACWLMTIAYLLYPAVVTNHVDRLGFENLALPFLFCAMLFFMQERFGLFMIAALLFMMGQENLPPTVIGFGIYALAKRRSVKWIISPMVMGAAYFVFVFKVALPYAAGQSHYFHAIQLGALGSTPGEALVTCVTHPLLILETMTQPDRLFYILCLLQPLLWLVPFFGWEILLVLPNLSLNLILPDGSFRVIGWHDNPTVGGLLCLATVFGVKRVADLLKQRWQLPVPEYGLALAVAASCVASWSLWLVPSQFEAHMYFPTLKKAAEMVPPKDSVLAPSSMRSHFADRDISLSLMEMSPRHPWKAPMWTEDKMFTFDYVIMDANDNRFPPELVTRDMVMSFYTNQNYQLLMNENNVFVFRKKTASPPIGVSASLP